MESVLCLPNSQIHCPISHFSIYSCSLDNATMIICTNGWNIWCLHSTSLRKVVPLEICCWLPTITLLLPHVHFRLTSHVVLVHLRCRSRMCSVSKTDKHAAFHFCYAYELLELRLLILDIILVVWWQQQRRRRLWTNMNMYFCFCWMLDVGGGISSFPYSCTIYLLVNYSGGRYPSWCLPWCGRHGHGIHALSIHCLLGPHSKISASESQKHSASTFAMVSSEATLTLHPQHQTIPLAPPTILPLRDVVDIVPTETKRQSWYLLCSQHAKVR
jgi:hypothetical protein